VNEQHLANVNQWLESRFGWQIFGDDDASIDQWVTLMGGWGTLSSQHQDEIRDLLRQALGPGSVWNPPSITPLPDGHPWWQSGFAPRLAFEQTGGSWYDNNANWFRRQGKAFCLNYWYRTFMVVDVAALDLVNDGMPSTYAAMSHFEFFAEIYALFYDLDDPQRSNIPADVIAWLTTNIGAPMGGAPAAPALAAAPPEPLPEWHWIRRPN
jgi:hypothetical protein